jgi:membrane associated rhomboid family serine protease
MAGAIAVSLHDHFLRSRWLQPLRCNNAPGPAGYDLTASGAKALAALGLNLDHGLAQTLNQASAHLGGALGAALLHLALTRKWLARELDSRALAITRLGHREFQTRFGLDL